MVEITKKAIAKIEKIAKEDVLRFPENRKWDAKDKEDRFRSLFGAPPVAIAAAWELIKDSVDNDIYHRHLLWGLVFLKVYAKNEETHCSIVGWPTKKEFREKSWRIVRNLADQKDKIIKLKNRFKNAPTTNKGKGLQKIPLLTGDCTDCKIDEPSPWNTKWKSHKFCGPGLQYIVALAIHSNNICFSAGPFPATRNESRTYKEELLPLLPATEPIEVDSGPGGDLRLMGPAAGSSRIIRKKKSVIRGRQETIFNRMKQYNVLETYFHHRATNEEDMMEKHRICFDACLVMTQLKFMTGVDTLFDSPDMTEVLYTMP